MAFKLDTVQTSDFFQRDLSKAAQMFFLEGVTKSPWLRFTAPLAAATEMLCVLAAAVSGVAESALKAVLNFFGAILCGAGGSSFKNAEDMVIHAIDHLVLAPTALSKGWEVFKTIGWEYKPYSRQYT